MNWLLLAVFIALCELVGVGGSLFTVRAIPTWYAKLRKPTFNPPNWVFGPVWTILYALQGIAAYLVFRTSGSGTAFDVFVVQLILNALWTPLFFGAKRLGAALVELVVLLIFIVTTVVLFSGVNAAAAWLMVPYALWSSFATVLNYEIWRLNR
ncbi:MAG TPA: TspO/MBR family protein [Candidatus Paceibacterota bacterium]|nr:TspO/MBR family protein [Candidatus Paceibacterota bacterium]